MLYRSTCNGDGCEVTEDHPKPADVMLLKEPQTSDSFEIDNPFAEATASRTTSGPRNNSSFQPRELYHSSDQSDTAQRPHSVLGKDWLPIFEHACDFGKDDFFKVLHYLVRNPNINSSLLFRADILYDSHGLENIDVTHGSEGASSDWEGSLDHDKIFPGYHLKRTLVRKFVPRNDSLDRSICQTVLYYESSGHNESTGSLLVMFPHVPNAERMPFYHPSVKGLAYLHSQNEADSDKRISIHYKQFSDHSGDLTDRQIRVARNLLGTLFKHGTGNMAGYQKRVHHDQIIEQKRVQDTFAELKRKHVHRLINNWVEKTDPAKQVFEQIGIASFLIELWKDMYALPDSSSKESDKPPFPGFVDVGCGNGVLVELLLLSGYRGWGLEGHRRRTWETLMPETQKVLVHGLVVPAPLDVLAGSRRSSEETLKEASDSIPDPIKAGPNGWHEEPSPTPTKPDCSTPLKSFKSWLISKSTFAFPPSSSTISNTSLPTTHNGLFPSLLKNSSVPSPPSTLEGQFLVSNHADELTAWTPLLASLTNSSFFLVPCCSRNLSGERFRAPSYANGFSADQVAPEFFSSQKITKKKHIPIPVSSYANRAGAEERLDDEPEDPDDLPSPVHSSFTAIHGAMSRGHNFINLNCPSQPCSPQPAAAGVDYMSPTMSNNSQAAEKGDLNKLSQKERAKQPSAYNSLCSWIVHLADQCGYLVEREYLRLPSTRNFGLVGRYFKADCRAPGEETHQYWYTSNGTSDNLDAKVTNEVASQTKPAVEETHQDSDRRELVDHVVAKKDENKSTEKQASTFEGRMQMVLGVIADEGGASRDKWVGVCEKEVVKGKDLDHL